MKTVLITGASTGIGRAAALYFAEKGWQVAATVRNPESNQDLTAITGIKVFALDVTKPETIERAISDAIQAFGQIDALVNNAGYGVDGIFEAMSDEVIQKQFDTNVFGLMRVTRAIIPYFRAKKSGTIIQIASVGGQLTFPLYSIYHGTKWAVEGFSESLAFELNPLGIRVKLIEPGPIKTDFYSRSRVFVKPEGISDYDETLSKVQKVIDQAAQKGGTAQEVAAAIYKAANSKSFSLRYPVGGGAPAILFLRKLLPVSWFRAMIRKVYGL